MTSWEPCGVCGVATFEGLLICYRCAALEVERRKMAGAPAADILRKELGLDRAEAPAAFILCPACGTALVWLKDRWRCEACGYFDVDG